MNKRTFLGLAICVLVIASASFLAFDDRSDATSKYFYSGLVQYEICSEEDLTVRTVKGSYNHHNYEDSPLVIPTTVENDGKTYTVVEIGNNTFEGQTGLRSITLPNTLQRIGSWAFYATNDSTPGLRSIDIPDSVTDIGPYAFSGCKYLEKVKLPKNLTEIKNNVFRDCEKLQYIEVSENVMFINNYAFADCELLETVILPESLEGMGDFVFEGCDQLRYIYIPKNVKDITWSSTFSSTGLEFIEVSEKNPYFMSKNNLVLTKDGETVVFCPLKVEEAMIPEGVKYIGSDRYGYAFHCKDLTSVTLPSTLITMTNSAFRDCYSLKRIKLPDSLQVIGNNTFDGCSSLKEINLPDSLRIIGDHAFSKCSSLKELVLPKTIKEIGDSAFSSCTSITGMIIPYGTEEIGDHAFWDCTSLVNLEIPDTVTELGKSVFERCENLVGARLPDGISVVGNGMFKECTSLRTIVIPANVLTVDDDTFYHCESLRSIEFPKTLETFKANSMIFFNSDGIKYSNDSSLAGKTFVKGGKDRNGYFLFYESYSNNEDGYMVTFKVDGNTYYKEFLKPGEKIVLPKDPVKKKSTGKVYAFSNWDGYTNGMAVTSDLILNAKFTELTTVQIQFIEHDSNVFKTIEYTYGSSLHRPTEKPNGYVSRGITYIFKDWVYKNENDITGLQKYHAEYVTEPGYFIKFNAAGGSGSMDPIFVKAGESVTLPTNTFIRNGYTFGGWTDGSKTYANREVISASNRNSDVPLTLNAIWNGGEYKLTINYIGPIKDGAFTSPATHTEMIANNEVFTVTSPVVNHYTASKELISGEISGSDVVINVYYKSNIYKIEYGTSLSGYLTTTVPKTAYSYTSEYVLPTGGGVTKWYSDENKTNPVNKISKFSTGDKKFWCDIETMSTVKFLYSTNYKDENYVVGTMDPITVVSGTKIILPECGFTYKDHKFESWFSSLYGEYQPGNEYPVYSGVTFSAKWKKDTYDLSITLVGPSDGTFDFGTNAKSFTGKVEWGEIELINLGIKNITIGGKTYAPEITKFDMPTKDQSLTIHYYDTGLDSARKEIVYYIEYGVTLPATNFRYYASHRSTVTLDDPVYEGHRFDGWYADSGFTNKIESIDLNVTGNKIIVYAKWTALENELRIVYSGPNNGKFHAPEDYVGKFKIKDEYKILSPDVIGYTPVSKYLEGKMGATDTVIHVEYIPVEWNIRYYTNGGDNAIDSIPDYTMTQSVTYRDPTREWYTFNGWYSDPELTEKVEGIPEGRTGFVRAYASWTPLSGGSVIINFIGPSENFTVPNKIEKHYADGERYSIDIPLITGYTPDREKVEGTMRTSDIVITVTYFANEHEIKVKTGQTDLETPEGWTKESDGVFSRTFSYASEITLPELSREGYTFRWSPDVPDSMPDNDLEFEAIWTETTTGSHYLIINYSGPPGDKNFATPNEIRAQIRIGESYEFISPVVEGYVPDKEVIKGVMGNDDIEITVTYSVKVVTVTFLPNNGGANWSIELNYDEKVARPETPTRDGHTFINWFNKGRLYDFDASVKDDINLTAEWNTESGEIVIAHINGQVEFNIPSKDSTTTNIVIELPNNVNITLGNNTIQSASGSNIKASMTKLDGEKFEITVDKDGETMNGAPMDITLPFTSGKGTPSVYYYPDVGDEILMGGVVDEASSTITFKTNHNSVYGIVYTTPSTPSTPTVPDDDWSDDGWNNNNGVTKKSKRVLNPSETFVVAIAMMIGALVVLTMVVKKK